MKKLLKNIVAFMMITALMVSACAVPAFAAEVQSNAVDVKVETPATEFVYTVLSDGTAEIAGYTGTDTDIVFHLLLMVTRLHLLVTQLSSKTVH